MERNGIQHVFIWFYLFVDGCIRVVSYRVTSCQFTYCNYTSSSYLYHVISCCMYVIEVYVSAYVLVYREIHNHSISRHPWTNKKRACDRQRNRQGECVWHVTEDIEKIKWKQRNPDSVKNIVSNVMTWRQSPSRPAPSFKNSWALAQGCSRYHTRSMQTH